MKRPAAYVCFFSLVFGVVTLCAQSSANSGRTLVVIPFENASPTPGLEWVGESFPEVLHQQLNSPALYVASREERLRAYDRQGIPATLHASRASLYRMAEQMDVDYAVLGNYHYDGAQLTATAQLLDMRAERLLPSVTESGRLAELGTVQSALAWDLLRQIRKDFPLSKDRYMAAIPHVRLDALENYVEGILAPTNEEKIQCYKQAVRISPTYGEAWFELGKTYFAERTYELAIGALSQVPAASPVAREANFYLGLAAYDRGDFAKAANAFEFVAARVPLAEVYNNLGVVALHRNRKSAAEYFQKALQNDPSDPDYHFNLAIALSSAGDKLGAARELHTVLERHPNDAEARALLSSVAPTTGGVMPAASLAKAPAERLKRNYQEDAFRQMTIQIQGWAEQRFARSDARSHARYHVELGKELLSHGFTTEAESEFNHAAMVDSASTAPLLGLADVALARGDTTKARGQIEAALRLHESAAAYLALTRLDLSENRTEAAAQNLNRALQLEPGNLTAQNLKRAVSSRLAEKAP